MLDRKTILQMAIKTINDTTGLNGFIPTLLIYNTFPRIILYNILMKTIEKWAKVYWKAIKELKEIQVKRLVQNTLAARNGLKTYEILNLLINSFV